jgi:hypothetical protein
MRNNKINKKEKKEEEETKEYLPNLNIKILINLSKRRKEKKEYNLN